MPDKIYEDEVGLIFVTLVNEGLGVFIQLKETPNKLSTFKHIKHVQSILDTELEAWGLTCYFTTCDSTESLHWHHFLGFTEFAKTGDKYLMIRRL